MASRVAHLINQNFPSKSYETSKNLIFKYYKQYFK